MPAADERPPSYHLEAPRYAKAAAEVAKRPTSVEEPADDAASKSRWASWCCGRSRPSSEGDADDSKKRAHEKPLPELPTLGYRSTRRQSSDSLPAYTSPTAAEFARPSRAGAALSSYPPRAPLPNSGDISLAMLRR